MICQSHGKTCEECHRALKKLNIASAYDYPTRRVRILCRACYKALDVKEKIL